MQFILKLTIREFRSSWRRLLFFFLCIALGVGSVVALRSLIQNLTQAVGTDARALLTADLEVSSTNDFSPVDIEKVEKIINSSPIVDGRNETITAAVMARPADPGEHFGQVCRTQRNRATVSAGRLVCSLGRFAVRFQTARKQWRRHR